jgi:L-iditol 2-dehydrogenase
MNEMRVARLYAPGDVRLHTEPIPRPHTDESLVRVTAVGICGSDLHRFAEGGIGETPPDHWLVLGHEFAGVVRGTSQRVAVDPLIACGECEPCREGKPNLCLTQHFAGYGTDDGALREWIVWQTKCLWELPDGLSDEDGAMLEPLCVAIHAVRLARIEPGMTVGVFGCGPIGLLIIQVARVSGAARIIATEKLSHRIDAAKYFGAETFLADGNEAQAILSATHQRGVDIVFEVAGEQTAVDMALASVKPGGLVVLAGIPSDDRTLFAASVARRKELTIKLVRRMRDTYPRAIQLVANEQIDVRSLVTHRFPLEKVNEAFAVAQRREGIKVMINC